MRRLNRLICPESSANVPGGADTHILLTVTLLSPWWRSQNITNFCTIVSSRAPQSEFCIPQDWVRTGNTGAAHHENHHRIRTRPSTLAAEPTRLAAPHGIKPPDKLQLLTPPPSTWRLATAKSVPRINGINSCNSTCGGCCKSPSITPNTCPPETPHPGLLRWSPAHVGDITRSWGYSLISASLIPRCGLGYCHLSLFVIPNNSCI